MTHFLSLWQELAVHVNEHFHTAGTSLLCRSVIHTNHSAH